MRGRNGVPLAIGYRQKDGRINRSGDKHPRLSRSSVVIPAKAGIQVNVLAPQLTGFPIKPGMTMLGMLFWF